MKNAVLYLYILKHVKTSMEAFIQKNILIFIYLYYLDNINNNNLTV